MQIENHKEEVPFAHYEAKFKELNPQEAMERLPGVKWDGSEFTLTLLGKTYAISHPAYAIRGLDGASVPALHTQTFLLRYLLEAKEVAWRGEWKTFREMPWGELYIKPYTGRVLTRAAYTFSFKLDAFRKAAEKMGAKEVKHGDAGFLFDLIGGYQMQIMIWAGDEEFPPNAQILYSDNFAEGFAAEDRVVVGDILITAIKANM